MEMLADGVTHDGDKMDESGQQPNKNESSPLGFNIFLSLLLNLLLIFSYVKW